GGDPAAIPQLTYEAFRDFHGRYYSPANTRLFLYGNIPTEDYLEFIQNRFLNRFTTAPKINGYPTILEPKAFPAPKALRVTFPAGAEDAEGHASSITVNWLLRSISDPVAVLSWEILVELLIGGAASPLQRALVDSEIGDDLSAPSGLETEL